MYEYLSPPFPTVAPSLVSIKKAPLLTAIVLPEIFLYIGFSLIIAIKIDDYNNICIEKKHS